MLKNIANSQIAFIFAFWTNAKFEERALEAAMNKQNEQKQARTEQCFQKWTITPLQAKTTVKAKCNRI